MKKKTSIRTKIMVPVLLLGIVSILSNVMALSNLRKVNNTASTIADEYLTAITELDTIGQTSKDVHTLALSHIVATDFATMTSVVTEIESEEAVLEEVIADYNKYVTSDTSANYDSMVKDYQTFKDSVRVLLAQSANQKTKDAYATANGIVADNSRKLNDDINSIIASFQTSANTEKNHLESAFTMSMFSGVIVIIISVVATFVAIFMVSRHVIRPVIKAEKELHEIIDGINNRQ